MRTLALASFALFSLCLAACGDNLVHGGGIDAAATDAAADASPDANCPARAVGMVGGPCTTSTECDSASGAGDGLCLRGDQGGIVWPAEGYCVNKLGCSTDNQCGAGNECVTINDPGAAFTACLPACGADPCECSNFQVCAASFSGTPLNKMACLPGNPAAVDGDRCVGFGDCDQGSICRADQFEFPGGQCMQLGCTIGTDATCSSGGDGHCIDPGFLTAGTGCVDKCTGNTDCRVADGYVCFDGGGTIGKYCRHPAAGDACAAPGDCGNASWTCKTGATFPGGMCTLAAACTTVGSGDGCSPGSSVCAAVTGGNFCVDRCVNSQIGTQGSCHTGYTCRDIDPGAGTVGGCVNP